MEKLMEKATVQTNPNIVNRMKYVTSRMVGMYRLIDEQLPTTTHGAKGAKVTLKPERTSRRAWNRFKAIYMDLLEQSLLDEKKMTKLIENSAKSNQGVGHLLNPDGYSYPKQAICIRLGCIMEKAIRTYILQRAESIPTEVKESFWEYSAKKTQWDVPFKKGNTVYLFETKYNLDLDTEKTNAVIDKLDTYSIFLRKYYKTQDINTVVNLVTLSFARATDVPKTALKNSLNAVKDIYLIGYSDLFEIFGVKVTQKMWESFHSKVVYPEIKRAYRRALVKYN